MTRYKLFEKIKKNENEKKFTLHKIKKYRINKKQTIRRIQNKEVKHIK